MLFTKNSPINEMIKIGWNLPHYNNVEGETYWLRVKGELQCIT